MQLQLAPKSFIEVVPVPPARRIASVDALRGFNIFWILGGDGAIWALDDMSSGKGPVVNGIGHFLGLQLHHVPWEGFQFYDFIFPLFIFITGVSIVLSLPRLVEREGTWHAHVRVLRRALLLYGLGLIYYGGISHHWADIRYVGVLQRIALCYLFASLLFLNFNLRGMMVAFVSLLLGYWALMTFVPVPGIGVGSFAPDANLANWLDAHYLPGRLWDRTRDPEGMLSDAAGDRHLSAGRVRRLAAEGRAARGAIQIAVADRRRDRAGCRRLSLGAAVPRDQGDLDLVIRPGCRRI